MWTYINLTSIYKKIDDLVDLLVQGLNLCIPYNFISTICKDLEKINGEICSFWLINNIEFNETLICIKSGKWENNF